MSTGTSLPVAGLMSRPELIVAELFGPTFQGEGPSTGQQAVFVRLSRCNLRCPGCDTPYTWDWSRFDPQAEARRLGIDDIAAWVLARSAQLVVITGGEPLLQQRSLIGLVQTLAEHGRLVEIETNGTIAPDPALVAAAKAFNVSPKLSSFASPMDRPIVSSALECLAGTGKAVFKFVATTLADLDDTAGLVAEHQLDPVWVMPAATSSGEVMAGLRNLGDEVLRRGWNLTGRLHLLLWEDTRGR